MGLRSSPLQGDVCTGLARAKQSCHIDNCQRIMPEAQQVYDDAMFDFSRAEYDACIGKLKSILAEDRDHFDAQLSLGMAYYRKGDYATAIAEGHKAEKLRPNEQLVHT